MPIVRMSNKMRNLLAAAALLAAVPVAAQYSGSRIFWDVATEKTVFSPGIYARVIQLHDGRLMAVCCWSGIRVSFSSNGGNTWTAYRQIVGNSVSGILNDTPDLIQLSDGTIIVGYNPRPTSPYSSDRKFGIRCVRSTDNGATWSDPIFIYDAGYEFANGCWEPSFLELPSGELQCYFSNEGNFTTSNDQSIDVSRSFDGGLTWSEPVTASYRAGSRDGMPKAIILKDGTYIVMTIEDNGWPGRGNFCATTIRTRLADNWKTTVRAGSGNRRIMFSTVPPVSVMSAAPYLNLLPWGETVASYQGNYGRPSAAIEDLDMFVAVGGDKATGFKAITQPFHLADNYYANWNSVAVVDTGQVMAVASVFRDGGASPDIRVIKGYPMRRFVAAYGRLSIDGLKGAGDTLTTASGDQVVMGAISRQRSTVDFAYDESNLYLYAYVNDAQLRATTDTANVLHFFIDASGVFSSRPARGLYHFGFNAGKRGLTVCRAGAGNAWRDYEPDVPVVCAVNTTRASRRYRVEAAIPWKTLGLDSAPVGKKMAVNLRVDFPRNGAVVSDTIADANVNRSATWMLFELQPSERLNAVKAVRTGRARHAHSAASYDLEGRRVENPHGGIYIVDGRKVLLK